MSCMFLFLTPSLLAVVKVTIQPASQEQTGLKTKPEQKLEEQYQHVK